MVANDREASVSRFATRRRRVMAGAPILRGHWASIVFTFLAGVSADKIEVVDRLTSGTLGRDGWVWWPTDTPWLILAVVCGVLGKLALDMYGRICWLTHAPPGTTWNGLTADEVRRDPWLKWPRWLMWNG